MCNITPILNGKDNLCWVSPSLNKKKYNDSKNEHVIKYIMGRSCQIEDTIAAIKSSVADDDHLHEQVQIFAANLFLCLKIKYGSENIKSTLSS